MRRIRIAFIQKEWEDNLGILWLSAVLRESGFETRIWVEGRRSYSEIKGFEPGIVAYTCLTGDQKWVLSSIKKIKMAGVSARIIVGGPHPTFFPDLTSNSLIDVICRGEGEYALLEYANALDQEQNRYDIRNLYFNVNGRIVKNDVRPLIENLDSLPFPDRSYYDRYKFLATNPFKIFITSRGCPFKCTFCFNHALHELYGKTAKYIRRRSVGNVLSEIGEVNRRWGIKEIRFSDDHFALDAEWLKEFAIAYKKECGKPYSINARVDALDEEKIQYLKASGCRLVCFGIESGREDLRNTVLRKQIKDKEIFEVAALLKKYKIKFLTSNIIGLPHESSEDAWRTIEMNQKIGTDLPWFSMMQYYPGTEIYKIAKEQGLLGNRFNVDELGGFFKNDYLQQPNIAELQNIHSFSILASRHKSLEPLAKIIVKKLKPNPLLHFIFKLSYLHITAKRAHVSVSRLARWWKYYLGKIVK